jgi:hypothetical protein
MDFAEGKTRFDDCRAFATNGLHYIWGNIKNPQGHPQLVFSY